MIYADAHADLFYEVAVNGCDIFTKQDVIHFTYDAMRAVNQRLQVCSLWTPPAHAGQVAKDFCDRMLVALDETCRDHPEALEKVTSGARLAKLANDPDGPIALVPWIEGGSPIMGSLDTFHEYADRGVKGVGLTWNHGNEIADGCGVAEPRRGLTEFGHQLVEAMEARRVLIDAAHLPEPAFWDVIKQAKRPIVITHCGLRWLVEMTRNPSPSMAQAVVDSGGFIGIDFYPGHINAYAGAPNAPQTTLAQLADTIREAINHCGADNIVLGGDFDGFRDPIENLTGVWDVQKIVGALDKAGLSESVIEKVMGRNLVDRLVDLW